MYNRKLYNLNRTVESCYWLLLVGLNVFIASCQGPTDPTDDLKVDLEIPASEAFDASYGFWGPEGQSIYFKHSEELGSEPDPRLLDQLWRVDLATGRRQRIHPGRILNADVNPDGQWIVFHSFTLLQYLYNMRSDGSALQRLTGPDSPNPAWEYTIMGKWSPSGDHILFAVFAGEPRGVALMRPDGTNPEIIIPYGVSPNWGPADNQLVYVNWDSTNQRQIYISDSDGAGSQKVTNFTVPTSELTSPSFSPDGSKIAFILNDEVHMMGTDGQNVKQITEGLGYTVRPEWSPDGQTLLFSRIIPNVSKRLYYLDVATREVTPVFPKTDK